MIFHTYGKKENKAIVLIHGVLTPWQIWNTAIRKFKRNYYVIVPELDAHTEVTPTVFHSVGEEADKIHDYIMEELNGHVFLLAGLSMGGRIAATLNDPAVAVSKAEIQGLKVKPVGKPVDQVPVHFVFIKDDNGAELLSRVDAALGKLKESGELAKLSTEWFDADYTEVRPE